MADGGIIALDDYRPDPHIGGECVCLACGHRWAGVAPVGTFELECPECGTKKGVWDAWCLKNDTPWWQCDCGCDLFRVHSGGFYCANCGAYQVFPG